MISDTYSYLNQAIAIIQGSYDLVATDIIDGSQSSLLGTPYALGNAHWLAFWIKLIGLKYVFLSSMFAMIVSVVALYSSLKKLQYPTCTVLLMPAFLSWQFFGKTLMSGVPSLMLVSIFTYILVGKSNTGKKWFTLCLIASLSFWFRESNIILLGGICLFHFIRDRKFFLHYAVGTVLGLLPRLISAHFAYGDPFAYVLAEPFSITNFVNQVGIYAIITLLLIPGGLVFLAFYRGKYFIEVLAVSSIFLVFYMTYGYTSVPYSGWGKGLILTGRFMLPLVPFMVIAAGYLFRNVILPFSSIWLFGLMSIVTIGAQLKINNLSQREAAVVDWIVEQQGDDFLFYDRSRVTNIIRYVNPMTTDITLTTDIAKLSSKMYMQTFFATYPAGGKVAVSQNTANEEKSNLTSTITPHLQYARDNYNLTEASRYDVESGLSIIIYQVTQK